MGRERAGVRGREFSELQAFASVARCGGFGRAAVEFGGSASAMSQVIRRLETRLGVALFNRTTRRVSPTPVGARLLGRLGPLFEEFDATVAEVAEHRTTPAGTLRVVTPRIAYVDHLEAALGRFASRCPDVVLDVTIDDAITDIVAGGYDLGIRLGELLKDAVVAFPIGGPLRQVAAASPDYLARHGTPGHPTDLHRHRCINWRQPGSVVPYQWEFAKGRKQVKVGVSGPLILNDRAAAVSAALQGVGVMFWVEHRLRPFIQAGRLVPVLGDWSPTFPGFLRYYRRRPQPNAALRAFVGCLRDAAGPDPDKLTGTAESTPR